MASSRGSLCEIGWRVGSTRLRDSRIGRIKSVESKSRADPAAERRYVYKRWRRGDIVLLIPFDTSRAMFGRKRSIDFAGHLEVEGEPFDWSGTQLWSAYWAQAHAGDKWLIEFESFTSRPDQGLVVAGRSEALRLRIVGRTSDQFVLWTDTAPAKVTVEVCSGQADGEIGFWNVWRDNKHGTMMYGVNASAIGSSQTALTKCSFIAVMDGEILISRTLCCDSRAVESRRRVSQAENSADSSYR